MHTPETTDTEDEFIPDDTPALPWWKRPLLFGLDAPWLAGIALTLILAAAYLWQRQAGGDALPDSAFSDVTVAETIPVTAPSSPVTSTTPAAPPAGTDSQSLASLTADVKAELDARDRTFSDSLNMMQGSITKLAEAVRRDEAYAQESRRQLDAMQATLTGLQAKAATPPLSPSGKNPKKKASAVSGMKVVSLESGMAWVRWQGSTWAVRQGDTLGKVTITGIDPGTRTLHTSGGDVR